MTACSQLVAFCNKWDNKTDATTIYTKLFWEVSIAAKKRYTEERLITTCQQVNHHRNLQPPIDHKATGCFGLSGSLATKPKRHPCATCIHILVQLKKKEKRFNKDSTCIMGTTQIKVFVRYIQNFENQFENKEFCIYSNEYRVNIISIVYILKIL